MEIVEKKGTSCRRLVDVRYRLCHSWAVVDSLRFHRVACGAETLCAVWHAGFLVLQGLVCCDRRCGVHILVAGKKLRDFTPTCKLPLRVWWEYSHQAKMSHFRKWFKCNFSSWSDESTLTILAKVVYRWAWNRAIFCSLLCQTLWISF